VEFPALQGPFTQEGGKSSIGKKSEKREKGKDVLLLFLGVTFPYSKKERKKESAISKEGKEGIPERPGKRAQGRPDAGRGKGRENLTHVSRASRRPGRRSENRSPGGRALLGTFSQGRIKKLIDKTSLFIPLGKLPLTKNILHQGQVSSPESHYFMRKGGKKGAKKLDFRKGKGIGRLFSEKHHFKLGRGEEMKKRLSRGKREKEHLSITSKGVTLSPNEGKRKSNGKEEEESPGPPSCALEEGRKRNCREDEDKRGRSSISILKGEPSISSTV